MSDIWISMPADVGRYNSMAFLMQFLLVLGGYLCNLRVQFHAYIHNITNIGFWYPYIGLYTFAAMGYQWVSISWSISVNDLRYTYICLRDMLSRDSISNITLYWFILWILGIGVHQYWPVLHKNSYIGNTFLAVTCNLQTQRYQNYQYISNRPNIPKNSIGDMTAHLIPS